MKKLLLAFVLFSCTSKNNNNDSSIKTIESDTEIIAKKMKEYINTNANDPSSYQPINTIFHDSLTYVQDLTSQIEGATHMLNFDKEEKRLYGSMAPATFKSEVKADQKKLDSLTKLKESFLKSNNANKVEYYYFLHTCRLKNGFGGLIKSTFRIITDRYLNIIKVVELK